MKIFPNLTIGGFTNSKDFIWLKEDVDSKNCIYLDIFLKRNDILSIDNHVVFINESENFSENKINPNIIRNIGVEKYTNKYPFSTFIFILYLLETNGYYINIDIDNKISYNGNEINIWELILRSDDTLLSSYKYKSNADDWWGWILNNLNETNLLYNIYNKVLSFTNDKNALDNKLYVNGFLQYNFKTHNDGYKNLNSDKFADFCSFILNIFDIEYEDFEKCEHNLIYKTKKFNKTNYIEIEKLINSEDMSTYAFIYGGELSYSLYK